MRTFLLGVVAGGWYGTELFEYARSSFVDGYAVEHVPTGCAQADYEYKNCLWASSLLFIQTFTFKVFSPKMKEVFFMAPAALSKFYGVLHYVRVTKKPSLATTCSLLRLPIPKTIARSAHVVVSARLLSKMQSATRHDLAAFSPSQPTTRSRHMKASTELSPSFLLN